MRVITDPREMRMHAEDLRRDGRRIAFVPTMGFLHQGHISLMEEGRRRSDVLIVSIFVNPTQFGPGEDLARYPRDLDGDLEKVRKTGADFVFTPDAAGMYASGHDTWVEPGELGRPLDGEKRPGHFRGVCTVVAKLFNIVRPHLAVFGEKDYQQLLIIRRMVTDLDLGIEIVGMPIVREPDGLAMSSRNSYLSSDERAQSLALSKALARAEELLRGGEHHVTRLIEAARAEIAEAPLARIDYAELRDAETLLPVDHVDRSVVLALAVYLGKTRLIDNRVLSPPRHHAACWM